MKALPRSINLHLLLAVALCLASCGDSDDLSVAPGPPAPPAPSTFEQQTFDIPSAAKPAHTPGSDGVTVSNEKLLKHFGADIDLNNARYTRYYLSDQEHLQPDAIFIAVPGFEGGASSLAILAENLLRRAITDASMVLELWAVDRRSNQLEDTAGLDLAEQLNDPFVGMNFLFGDALGLELGESLEDGPGRRAVFYNSSDDLAFIANWTTLTHSQDIDAIVDVAISAARDGNVFLGGHSAGTGYTARYAATDFNLSEGEVQAGYRKLRGLVLLEGSGARINENPPDTVLLDVVEARFDGGLFGAVRDQQARCIDGQTACSVAGQAGDCAAFGNNTCTEPTSSYAVIGGLLSPQLLAISEVSSLQATIDGDAGVSILQQDQNGEAGNNAVAKAPGLEALRLITTDTPASSVASLGRFLDDDGFVAGLASFLATSLGVEGPVVDGVVTWISKNEGIPDTAFVDNGPAPTQLADIAVWGVEAEPTDLEGRLLPVFYRGKTNFSDWYYPSSGLGITAALGLDTSALSAPPPLGRGRSDIDNLTQAGNIDIPVIAFGGSNGLTPVPAAFMGFAEAIGPCTAPGCDGATPRVVDQQQPSPAFPSYGGIAGGFEVHISEGYAHVDIVTADDDEDNQVIGPLVAFFSRNSQ